MKQKQADQLYFIRYLKAGLLFACFNIVIGIALGLFQWSGIYSEQFNPSQQQATAEQFVVTSGNGAQVNVQFAKNSLTSPKISEPFTLDVVVKPDSNSVKVSGVDITVTFNTKQVKLKDVTYQKTGNEDLVFAPDLDYEVMTQGVYGTIQTSVLYQGVDAGFTTEKTIMKLTFVRLTNEAAVIAVDQNTTVVATDNNPNENGLSSTTPVRLVAYASGLPLALNQFVALPYGQTITNQLIEADPNNPSAAYDPGYVFTDEAGNRHILAHVKGYKITTDDNTSKTGGIFFRSVGDRFKEQMVVYDKNLRPIEGRYIFDETMGFDPSKEPTSREYYIVVGSVYESGVNTETTGSYVITFGPKSTTHVASCGDKFCDDSELASCSIDCQNKFDPKQYACLSVAGTWDTQMVVSSTHFCTPQSGTTKIAACACPTAKCWNGNACVNRSAYSVVLNPSSLSLTPSDIAGKQVEVIIKDGSAVLPVTNFTYTWTQGVGAAGRITTVDGAASNKIIVKPIAGASGAAALDLTVKQNGLAIATASLPVTVSTSSDDITGLTLKVRLAGVKAFPAGTTQDDPYINFIARVKILDAANSNTVYFSNDSVKFTPSDSPDFKTVLTGITGLKIGQKIDIRIWPEKHLNMTWTQLLVTENNGMLTLTNKPLLPGDLKVSNDFNQDMVIDYHDVGVIKDIISANKMTDAVALKQADLNFDKRVDNLDYSVLRASFVTPRVDY